ncbi:hypothetical protein ACOMHN_058113 [Nucella lapillus]
MASTEMTNESTLVMVTEMPYEDYPEVKTTIVLESLRTTSTCIYMAAITPLDCIILTHGLCMVLSRYVGDAVFFMHTDWNCGFQHFIFYFALHLDVLVLLAMTVDRFIVVKFPLKAMSLCTPKSAIRVITVLGILSFAFNFHIFFNRRLNPTGKPNNPMRCWYIKGDVELYMNKIFTVIDATIYSFVPCIALITLNLLIIRQLRQSRKFSKQFTESSANPSDSKTSARGNSGGTGSAKKSTNNTNITLMLLLVSFGFLVLTSPIVIVLLYQRYVWKPSTNTERAQLRLVLGIVESIMYSNHAVNFLLYSISGQRFRQELKQLLARLRCCS